MSEQLNDFVPELPIWGEVETGKSGWSVQPTYFQNGVMHLYRSPNNAEYFLTSAQSQYATELTNFLFNLPLSCAERIVQVSERIDLGESTWAIMPNGYKYAKVDDAVYVQTKPCGFFFRRWNLFPFGYFNLVAKNLSAEAAEELVEYVCTR